MQYVRHVTVHSTWKDCENAKASRLNGRNAFSSPHRFIGGSSGKTL
jgi:hypothetical protein